MVGIIFLALRVVEVLILIRIVLSWIMPSRNEFTELVYSVTEPILSPFRVMLPLGHARLDLAPIIVYFLIGIIKRVVISFAY